MGIAISCSAPIVLFTVIPLCFALVQSWDEGLPPPKWANEWGEKIGEASKTAADRFVAAGDSLGENVTDWGQKMWSKTKEAGAQVQDQSEQHLNEASTQTGNVLVRVGQWFQGKSSGGDPWRSSGSSPPTRPA